MRNVKVFLSSPGDLYEERQIVAQLIRALNDRATIRDRYKFSPYLFEHNAPAVTGEAPQEVVNEHMLQPHDADIVICMLWSRMGTPLTEINPDTGLPYASGTEYEFYDAYRSYRRRKRPIVLLYRYRAPAPEGTSPDDLHKVDQFFSQFRGANAPLHGLYHSVDLPEALRETIINDIDAQIARWERPTQRLLDQVIRPFWFVFLLILVGLIAGLLVLPSLTGTGTPPIENAPFNVAIAGFTVAPGSNVLASDVDVLTQAFYTNFVNRLDDVRSELPLVVGIWSPAQIGSVTGATPADREQNAQALEKRLRDQYNARADIIIYGVVAQQNDRIAVLPEFYITNNWPEVNEVFGRFDLAAALYAPNIDQTRALAGDLSNRSQVLASITQGLVQMIFHQYDDARRAFDSALNVNQDIVGQELIYVLRANASLGNYNRIVASGDSRQTTRLPTLLEQAQSDFQQAIQVNPDYARGYAGLGGTEYLNALDPISARQSWSQISSDTLDSIEKTYNEALTASDRPASADIPTKVEFGLGQVALVRFLQGQMDAGEKARSLFNQVLADYGDGANPRVKELAAEANARLGFLNRYAGDLQAAQTYYQAALKLTDMDERRLLFQRSLTLVTIDEKRAARDIDGAAAPIRIISNSICCQMNEQRHSISMAKCSARRGVPPMRLPLTSRRSSSI